MVNEIEAGHSGHADIRNNAIEPLSALDRGQKIFGGRKARCFDALAGKIKPQQVEHRLVVVDDCNARHACAAFATGSVK